VLGLVGPPTIVQHNITRVVLMSLQQWQTSVHDQRTLCANGMRSMASSLLTCGPGLLRIKHSMLVMRSCQWWTLVSCT
jgi:hypothetical protein